MKSDIKLKLGEKIKLLRRQYGFTQEKLSALSNIDYKYIQKIEEKNPPSLKIETIERIAKAFRITLSKLLEF